MDPTILSEHFFLELIGLEVCSDLMRHVILHRIGCLSIPIPVCLEVSVKLRPSHQRRASTGHVLKPSVGEARSRELNIEGIGVQESAIEYIMLLLLFEPQ